MRRFGDSKLLLICGASALFTLLLSGCGSQYTPPAEIAEAAKLLPEQLDYNWDVRPILSQNCFNCHGNSTQESGLRLDVAENAYAELAESPGKHAIAPGKPEKSELVRRITTTDPDGRTRPPGVGSLLPSHGRGESIRNGDRSTLRAGR